MTFTLESRVVERVPAWEVCECIAEHKGLMWSWELADCPSCQGEGGKWHEAIEYFIDIIAVVKDPGYIGDGNPPGGYLNEEGVWKDTILVREHFPCSPCSGRGYTVENYHDGTKMNHEKHPCKACLKDADGKPTGAEKDTASEWRVQ